MMNKPQQFTHYCLRNLLIIAQILGVFPVNNINNNDANQLYFKWGTFKVFYTILLAFMYLFCTCLSLYKASTQGILINQLVSPLFYFHAFTTSISLLHLSTKWPSFIVNLTRIEEHILKKYDKNLKLNRKINIGIAIMILIALIEHLLATLNVLYTPICENPSQGWEYYYRKHLHFIFRYIPYNFYLGLLFTIISWYCAFVWNFGDIFIVVISILITTRFRQLNNKIRNYCNDIKRVEDEIEEAALKFIKVYQKYDTKFQLIFWRKIREDYTKLCEIVRHLNQLLSNLVVFSYALNLTFILIQLFNSLRPKQSTAEGIYFYYSFGLVIGRILFVSIHGALINESSKEALPLLHALSTDLFNQEIQRLITQIYLDTAALTGHNFFRITKGLVLSVAAAVITYELVLVQFNQATVDKYMASNESICL